jgi:hypothetical protein
MLIACPAKFLVKESGKATDVVDSRYSLLGSIKNKHICKGSTF